MNRRRWFSGSKLLLPVTAAIVAATLLAATVVPSHGTAQGDAPPEVRADSAGLTLVEPVRVLDTRSAGGQSRMVTVPIAGVGGVPEWATGVAVNVTVVGPSGPGFVTAHACGAPAPATSFANFATGETVAGLVVSALSAEGELCIRSRVPIGLVVDVVGYLNAGSDLAPRQPARLADTRRSPRGAAAKPTAGTTITVGVPGATGHDAVLSVTVTEPAADGFLTVYPCDQPRPVVSQVTYGAGQTVASTVLSGLDDRRQVCVYTSAAAHLVVDHQFDVLPGRSVRTVAPARLWDSRAGRFTVDQLGGGSGPTQPGSVTAVPVAGRAGVPADASAAVLSVTVTGGDGPGHVTAAACGQPVPGTSNLNHPADATRNATVIAALDAEGRACLYTHAVTDLIVDVTGYLIEYRDSLSAGGTHSCATTGDGRVACWGDGRSGQLGTGTFEPTATPTVVSGVRSAGDVAAGGEHTCAVDARVVRCWGANSHGQLGALAGDGPRATPVAVGLADTPVAVAAGDRHTCALDISGSVWCWGDNRFGQSSSPARPIVAAPTLVELPHRAVDVVAGGNTTCAIDESGTPWCWGALPGTDVPTAVVGPEPVRAVAVGYRHACVLTMSGRVSCWGDDSIGQLDAPDIDGVVAIGGGSGDHTCAVTADRQVICWGAGHDGQLEPPVGLQAAVEVSVGDRHSCARLVDGAVRCWGDDTFGQTGLPAGLAVQVRSNG